MRLEPEPNLGTTGEAPSVAESTPSAAVVQLTTAREADAAWRVERSVRLATSLANLNRYSRRIESSLWGSAGVAFGCAVLLLIRGHFEPSEPRWGTTLDVYDLFGFLCLMVFAGLAFAAFASRPVLSWLQRRLRAQAAAEGIDFDD